MLNFLSRFLAVSRSSWAANVLYKLLDYIALLLIYGISSIYTQSTGLLNAQIFSYEYQKKSLEALYTLELKFWKHGGNIQPNQKY
jgi:hypothetical protein